MADSRGNPVTRPIVDATLEIIDGPKLLLPTGELVTCGPEMFACDQSSPLVRKVAPGSYPTCAVAARLPDGTCIPALMALQLAAAQAESFAPAHTHESLQHCSGREVPGISVDLGVVMIADAALDKACRDLDDPPDLRRHEAVRSGNISEGAIAGAPIANFVACPTGLGDGLYPIIWGLDSNRQPACLLIDFDVIDWGGIPAGRTVHNPWSA